MFETYLTFDLSL